MKESAWYKLRVDFYNFRKSTREQLAQQWKMLAAKSWEVGERLLSLVGVRIYRMYCTGSSEYSLEKVKEDIDRNVIESYQNENSEIKLAPLSQYDEFLGKISSISKLQMVTGLEFSASTGKENGDKILGTIRHDVDCDLIAAVAEAELEHKHGICSTFYFLHTSTYYGEYRDGKFHRNESSLELYRKIADLGHEIGLHIDPYFFYQEHGVNGAKAVKAEIEWLRENGIEIRGTAGHNCPEHYGAHSWEIFKELHSKYQYPCDVKRNAGKVVWNGKECPLRRLSMKKLGLQYEADSVRHDEPIPLEASLFNRNTSDEWAWGRSWLHLGYLREELTDEMKSKGAGDMDSLLDQVSRLADGDRVVFAVHPIYYGNREHIVS